MKNIVILIIIIGIGYFAYQHFFSTPLSDTPSEHEIETVAEDDLPPIPDSCERLSQDYENAVYGQAKGQASFAHRNRAGRALVSCLQKEGFSEAEINGTLSKIEKDVERFLRQE